MSASPGFEALLFDLGGVLVDIDFTRAFHAWAHHSPHPAEELGRRFSMDDPYARHERGEIDAGEYFAHLREHLDLAASDAEILTGWNAIFLGQIEETLADLHRVRERIPCFAFSNSNPSHQAAWSSAFPEVVEVFQEVFVSSELGLRKPERAAFEAVGQAVGVAPSATLFFDDTEENVEGARAAGLTAVLVRSPEDVRVALRDAGFL